MRNLIGDVQNKYSYFNNVMIHFWKTWTKSSGKLKLFLRNTKWKNAKAKPGCAYRPTDIEQLANIITHGIWIIPAVMAALKLFDRSTTPDHYTVSWIYGGALTMLFTVSTFFHCSCYCHEQNSLKNILHRCDRAMIYIFIAGSYFPWLTLGNHAPSKLLFTLEWLIWVLALLGITYQQIFHERFKCLETCFYILMGLGPGLVVYLAGYHFDGMAEIKLGGFLYILGIGFFKSDGIIPMAHAIWHIFVILAASIHYYAILVYLFPKELVF